MNSNNEHIINLDLPASERWLFLKDYINELNELLTYYLNDFTGAEFIFNQISDYKKDIIPQEYLDEIKFISSISKFSENEVLIANLYYDVLKFYLGCTAFAFKNNSGVFHARNLDWWTENNMLSKYSKVFNYQKNGSTVFKTVSWIGFIGSLSGVKPGKFSVTLNAVLSNDNPEIAFPVSFLIREVLSYSNNFNEAKKRLKETTIASDCLLLLSGIEESEMVVIERTPKRNEIRKTNTKYIAVTNDYKILENNQTEQGLLQSSSCGRYDRTMKLLTDCIPKNTNDCFKILQDEKVIMGITVQQMVFNNKTGEIKLIKTNLKK